MTETGRRVTIPREKENDYSPEAARARQAFLAERTGVALEHVSSYSFDPEVTRGKRVVAEALIPDALFGEIMHSSTDLMYRARQVSNLGGFMSGVNNNGAHSANGITAVFIATGQDVANVAESSAAFVFAEVLPNGDYYYSVTIPSLIVATYGGGTGLATQRECLEILGCYGAGKVQKFAEIVAATVLCGERSLGSAIVAEEWGEAHDLYGRNRR
jgi:hydroxymethylglutaryl-CoA reductase (NADPH)